MDPEIINHAVNHTDDEENSVYSSGMVPDMMWKIREDCEKLMNSYNESSEGKFPLADLRSAANNRPRFWILNWISLHNPCTTYIELYCPPTFDGWSCWNATPAGRISVAPCPYFITGFDPQSNMRHSSTLALNFVTRCLVPSSFLPKYLACYPRSPIGTQRNNNEWGWVRKRAPNMTTR